MWSWLLRRMGVLELLEESARAQLAAEERADQAEARRDALVRQRDTWRKRAGGNAKTVRAALNEAREAAMWAEAAERRAVEADIECQAALRLAKAHIQVFNILMDPHFGEVCKKIRCYSEEVADKLARIAERGTGLRHGSMRSYACPRCPPQPVSNERWWHITMVDPELRGRQKYNAESRQNWVQRSHARLGTTEQERELKQRLFGETG